MDNQYNIILAALEKAVSERLLIIDGAMGTMIERHQLEEADFRGERFREFHRDLKGNNDLLCLTRRTSLKRYSPGSTWRPAPTCS